MPPAGTLKAMAAEPEKSGWPHGGLWERPGHSLSAPVLVLLHGLGADRLDMKAVGEALDPGRHWHILAPDAPVRRVTLNGGQPMQAWFDISRLDQGAQEDGEGMSSMAEILRRRLLDPLGRKPVVLGGFSQGGAMSLYAALRAAIPSVALLVFSGYLPQPDLLPQAWPHAPQIFWGHGRQDGILPLSLARRGASLLQEKGFSVAWRDYSMTHGICQEEIQDAARFLHTVARQFSG